jgi:hypothetical protein
MPHTAQSGEGETVRSILHAASGSLGAAERVTLVRRWSSRRGTALLLIAACFFGRVNRDFPHHHGSGGRLRAIGMRHQPFDFFMKQSIGGDEAFKFHRRFVEEHLAAINIGDAAASFDN